MSEMEKVELMTRVKAMAEDEKKLTVMALPDDILIEELHRRYAIMKNQISNVRKAIRISEDN